MKNELLTIGPFTVYGYGLMIAGSQSGNQLFRIRDL